MIEPLLFGAIFTLISGFAYALAIRVVLKDFKDKDE